ncbi:MAG: N-acetylmuramoyl-L-alanine amidase family protein [Sediminispirochaetaceae bacterium]
MRLNFNRILLFLTVFLLFTAAAAAAESGTSLQEILQKTGAHLEWDAMRGIGRIEKGDKTLVVGENYPFLLINYEAVQPITSPWRGPGGGIFFSDRDAPLLLDKLGLLPDTEGQLYISTIIIDAGHGGKDPGAIGRFRIDGETTEIREKDLVLQVSTSLAYRLGDRYPEKRVVLTRDEDVYLTLEERTEIANNIELGEQEAMIFISIHANASLNSKADGFEVWYLPPNYRRELIDPATLDQSAREVAPILNTMLEEEYTVESILLAQNILEGLERKIGAEHENRGLKEETWFVVRNAKMPSVLVEIGFVTNREEALKMKNTDHLMKITEGIYNGVCGFIEHFEKPFSLE